MCDYICEVSLHLKWKYLSRNDIRFHSDISPKAGAPVSVPTRA